MGRNLCMLLFNYRFNKLAFGTEGTYYLMVCENLYIMTLTNESKGIERI